MLEVSVTDDIIDKDSVSEALGLRDRFLGTGDGRRISVGGMYPICSSVGATVNAL